jgi:hypothetical protein
MSNQSFISAVQNSRVLNHEQKEALLEDPDAFPEEYRMGLEQTLLTFDENSKAREVLLREKLEENYQAFAQRLDLEGIEEKEKLELLAKAKKQMDAFFPKT